MNGITTTFDYDDLPEPEVRHCEKQANRLAEIRGEVTRSAIETGRILAEVHERLANRKTGTFERWVEDRCGMSSRHARRFLAVAERFADTITGHHVRLYADTALFELAAPSCPDAAVKEAEKLATRGTVVTARLAKQLIEKHKPADNSYTAHGLPGAGKPGEGSKTTAADKRSAKLDKLNQQQEAKREGGPAASDAPGQPADERGGVGTAPDAGPSIPDDGPVVIETTARVVAQDPIDELVSCLTAAILASKRISDELRGREIREHLTRILDAAMTGEPIEAAAPAAEPSTSRHEVTGEPSVMVFDITPSKKGGCAEWGLPQSYVDELQEVFAGVDVLAECRKARLWCANNPTKRKTAKGMREFLRRWCEKQQNSVGNRGPASHASDPRLSVFDEYLEKYGEAS